MADDSLKYGTLLIRCATQEQYEKYLGLAWSIINCTGGWARSFGKGDDLGPLEFRLITHRASDEELQSIRERVLRGEPAKVAIRSLPDPRSNIGEGSLR
jgi:hypothetical protein